MAKSARRHRFKTGMARRLRREQTEAEKTFWRAVRRRQLAGLKFRRQVPIGPYIADFVCHERCLIVELDGSQHSPEREAPRTAFLERAGYRVLRFSNAEVLQNRDGVLETLLAEIEPRS